MQHRIAVIRHAKAEQDGPTDAERPLADRGHDDAREGGRWLADQGFVPDRAIVSAALRARETWESLAEGAGWDVEPELDRSLYSASPETVLDLLRTTPDDVATVVVVGHNPTVGTTAQLLDDGTGDAEAGREMAMGGYPTCSIALFEHDGSWSDLDFPSAALAAFHVGRA